jgi:hypothetical protein
MQKIDPTAAILSQLTGGGWDSLNNMGASAEADLRRMSEDAEREARIVLECFGTEAGKACLEWLIKKTILRGPNADQQGASNAEHYAIASAKREGQNQIIFLILQALNHRDVQQ